MLSETARSVEVISREEIAEAPTVSIHELLSNRVGIDLQQRGLIGVQADAGIRGGSFEQTLILIDGVRMSDIQTGHHNLILPITMADIDRVEILKGPGTRIFGPNAFDGVINIITNGWERKSVTASAMFGQNNLYGGEVFLSYPIGGNPHRLSVMKMKSDGYRYNTDFDILTVSIGSSLRLPFGHAVISGGYTDKKYGANGFYLDKYPDQWEHTETAYASIITTVDVEDFSPVLKLQWRRNDDDYMFERNRPTFNRTLCLTNSFAAEGQSTIESALGITTIGIEYGVDFLESVQLGDHDRDRGGVIFEHKMAPVGNMLFALGAAMYKVAGWGSNIWPGLDVGYRISDNMNLFATIGASFRAPTYKELFNTDDESKGNPDLQTESAWTIEMGLNWKEGTIDTRAALFQKSGKNIIDWVRTKPGDIWRTRNTASVVTNGIELQALYKPEIPMLLTSIRGGYAFLNLNMDPDPFESRYFRYNLIHQIIFDVKNDLVYGLKQSSDIRILKRSGKNLYPVVDTRVSWSRGMFEVYLTAKNLFNTAYIEIGNIPMPGRWLLSGVRINYLPGD